MTTGAPRRRSLPVRIARWFGLTIAALAVFLLVFSSAFYSAGSWMVHLGLGQRGTFTEESEDCGKVSCIWSGTFTPENNGPVQYGASLEDGGNASGPTGSQVTAVYALGEVYPLGGGSNWITYTMLFVIEVAALVAGTIFWRRRRRRRRQTVVPAQVSLSASAP